MSKIFVLILSILFVIPATHQAFAFNDEIGASISEVWQATLDTYEKPGVYKKKLTEGKIITNWHYDEVKRSRGFFRGFTKRLVKRRYRFKIDIGKGETATKLQIKVQVSEKTANTNPSIPWKTVKLDSEDYILEQEAFFKILNQLALNKQKIANPEGIPVV